MQLSTDAKITWCPGCPNNAILVAFRKALTELSEEGKLKIENVVAAAGIGCHGKIIDYLKMNTFNSLHGRSIPAITGIKVANPNLTVVAFSGDGDSYSEGFSHLVHAAERNSDINVFVHDNQVFALTTGQATATSPEGFKGGSRPQGSTDSPINPISVMLSSGATFVARAYAGDIARTKDIMKAAFEHRGFSFVDIIQPCITFFDTRDFYKENIVSLPDDHDVHDLAGAFRATHREDSKVPTGIFYRIEKPTFEDKILS